MKFSQMMEAELSHIIEEEAKRPFSGSVDAFSERNSYEVIPTPDGEFIISVDNRGGNEGVVEVSSNGVLYKDNRGNVVHRENRKPYAVTRKTIENHYLPTLLSRTRMGDMFECDDCSIEELPLTEAVYKGEKVTLNKPFRLSNANKKYAVYVKNDKGNIVKVTFGDPNMTIKRDDPERRKAFRARHNCSNPGPKWKARYWSCRSWSDNADWV